MIRFRRDANDGGYHGCEGNSRKEICLPGGCFRIQGWSGASAARPGLLAALEGAKEGDTLTVWRIDRLGRSTLHLLQILDDLGRKGIAFQSLMDGLDTNTAAGRMVFSMVSAMAESSAA